MTDMSDSLPEARERRHRWVAWVWFVPIAAAAIVVWLAWHSFYGRGPEIQITFKVAEGLEAKQSLIQHRGVPVGTVESLELSPDLTHVIVHARISRAIESALNENTRFYIVTPHVGVEGITGLSTLVSGSYIDMYTDKGTKPQHQFLGLEDAPVLRPDTAGRSFQMVASDLGSLTRGSPISYRGISVGEVETFALSNDGKHVNVTAFIRAPYDRFVHPETRFWNAGGVDVSAGAQGVRIRANSWQQLLSGGIAFDTPASALVNPPSEPDAVFTLYDNNQAALRVARGELLVYLADFTGNLRGVDTGTTVELEGFEIGEVKAVELKYDEKHHTLATLVTLSIDPERVQIRDIPRDPGANQHAAVDAWIERLVHDGLRAQVTTANLLTGFKIIALDMVNGAPPAKIVRAGQYISIPTSSSSDIAATLDSLRKVLNNIDRITSGPQIENTLKSINGALDGINQLTHSVEPDLKSLIVSLRQTSDSIQTLAGGGAAAGGPPGPDIGKLTRELTEAARSVRTLADYLDRHPEALLRGRKGADQ